MGSTTVQMQYEEVRKGIATINNCSNVMDNILTDFSTNINTATSDENFQGVAKESLTEQFNLLKQNFDSYINLLIKFAKMYNVAVDFTERTETALKQEADNLEQGPKIS
jgi:uncharacterized protein YukE